MEGRFSDQPDQEHSNSLKPVRTRDDVGKNLANAVLTGFRRTFPTLKVRFPSILSIFRRIRMYDVTTSTTSIEFDATPHKTSFANLGRFLFGL